ncbi:MAG: hypothetical protein HC876_12560 [Chloroflexaceae bacterium]|nr:hypothetical protein [Chloroflexaceae bacterium]
MIHSLEDHLVSDVPIGAFLSGGIDSSLLVALLVKQLGVTLDTFTVKFGEAAYDESAGAQAVATYLGTRHHQIEIPSGASDLDLAQQVLDQFDQPFGDSSAIPTYLISRAIRTAVKVAIAGDGGDEMFGGYPRFRHADLAFVLGHAPHWVAGMGLAGSYMAGQLGYATAGRAGWRMMQAVQHRTDDRLLALSCYTFPHMLNEILRPATMRHLHTYRPKLACPATQRATRPPAGPEFIDATIAYALPGDYLRKVDVMSSAHGLEVRVPLLGMQVLDCAARLPHRLRYTIRDTKLMLRTLIQRYLPAEVAHRPKSGFGIPLDSWLGAENRADVSALLMSPQARIRDLVHDTWRDAVLNAFISGSFDTTRWSRFRVYQYTYFLWSLERWLCRWQPTL